MRRIPIVLLALIALDAAPAMGATATVQVGSGGFNYSPQSVTINPGDAVQWNWAGFNHSVTSGARPPNANGLFDSQIFSAPHSFNQTFDHPGTYLYFCKVHYASGMVGTIKVSGTDPPPTAAFTASSSMPSAGQSVTFDASASSTSDTDTIDSYTWDFGDGSSSQTTSSPTITHQFLNPGSVTVRLTVIDAGSAASSPASRVLVVTGSTKSGPAVVSKLRLGHKRFCTHKSRRCRHPGTRITFTLSQASVVTLMVKRHARTIIRRRVHGQAGRNAIPLKGGGLRKGRYVLTLTPAGGRSVRASFNVVG